MKIRVDYERCESHGRCMEAAPDIFEVREDDLMYVLQENPADDRRAAVELAVKSCPMQALSLLE